MMKMGTKKMTMISLLNKNYLEREAYFVSLFFKLESHTHLQLLIRYLFSKVFANTSYFTQAIV